jgi:hypothetical protein
VTPHDTNRDDHRDGEPAGGLDVQLARLNGRPETLMTCPAMPPATATGTRLSGRGDYAVLGCHAAQR